MYHAIAASFLLAGLLITAGCGQTGPLYLPEQEPREAPDKKPEAEPSQPSEASEPAANN